jgi:hypothetical protein
MHLKKTKSDSSKQLRGFIIFVHLSVAGWVASMPEETNDNTFPVLNSASSHGTLSDPKHMAYT